MSDIDHTSQAIHRRPQFWLVLAASLILAVTAQWFSGAYHRDFSFSGDEPSHFVTSLMVCDYLRTGLSVPPFEFAENYYIHYPKVAIGHWPPGFYALMGGWMLLFGGTQVAASAFLALATALVSVLLWSVLVGRTGAGPAWFAALSFPLLPLVQIQTSAVMTEVPGALALFAALVALSAYFTTGATLWSAAFAALTVAAIQIRPSGWMLGLLVPLAAALTGRFRQLFGIRLLSAAAAVAALCLPFYLRFLPTIQDGTSMYMGFGAYIESAIPWFTGRAAGLLTPVPTLALAAGLIRVGRPWQASDPFWGVMTAGWFGALLFNLVTPAGLEARHLVPMAAPGLALAALGLSRCVEWRPQWGAALVAGAVAVVAMASLAFSGRPLIFRGFEATVELLESDPQLKQARVMMISSGANGEGRLIAELANREGCCRRIVLRATQQLADANWDARLYELRYQTTAAIHEALLRKGVGLVLVHDLVTPDPPLRHHELLKQMLAEFPEDWQLTNTVRRPTHPGAPFETIAFYRHRRLFGTDPPLVEIDSTRRLGRLLRLRLDGPGVRRP